MIWNTILAFTLQNLKVCIVVTLSVMLLFFYRNLNFGVKYHIWSWWVLSYGWNAWYV